MGVSTPATVPPGPLPPLPSAAFSGDNCLQGSLSLHFWGQLPPPTFPDPCNAVKGGLRSLPAKGRERKADFPEKKLTHPWQLIYLALPFLSLPLPCSALSPLPPKEQGRPCSWQPGPGNSGCPCCSSEPAATEGGLSLISGATGPRKRRVVLGDFTQGLVSFGPHSNICP